MVGAEGGGGAGVNMSLRRRFWGENAAPMPQLQSGRWLACWIITIVRVYVCVCVSVCSRYTYPPPHSPLLSHCITDSVARHHHIKLALMKRSEQTEGRDNQTFIKWLNLLYLHYVMIRQRDRGRKREREGEYRVRGGVFLTGSIFIHVFVKHSSPTAALKPKDYAPHGAGAQRAALQWNKND